MNKPEKLPICNINGVDYFEGDSFMGNRVEYWIERELLAREALRKTQRQLCILISNSILIIFLLITWMFQLLVLIHHAN